MKNLKIILAVWLFSALVSGMDRHEFSLYLGTGLSSLRYDEGSGERKGGAGGLGGFGYSVFFTETFGLGTGIEAGLYNSLYKVNGFSTAYSDEIDIYEDPFQFRSVIYAYEEKHGAVMLQLPIMLRFQSGRRGPTAGQGLTAGRRPTASNQHKYYLAMGGKAAIPLWSRAVGSGANLMNYGYYPELNCEFDEQRDMGFGAQSAKGFEKDLDLKVTLLASVETGVKFRLKDGLSLYTGIYFDYGLQNILQKTKTANLVEYNSTDFTMNSVFDSFVEKVTPMTVGLKVGLAFGKGNFGVTEKAAVASDPYSESDDVIVPIAIRETATIQDGINFELGTATLLHNSHRTLEGIYLTMEANPDMVVEIAGHTCNSGGYEFNMRLSQNRAQAVADYLVSRGISAGRLVAVGRGFDRPIADNNTEEGREKNRRVEIRSLR